MSELAQYYQEPHLRHEITTSLEVEPSLLRVWERFAEISAIPRPTGGEKGMTEYLKVFAQERSLVYEEDAMGNMLITVPATPGYEGKPGIIIQGHTDMVCIPTGENGPAIRGVKPVRDESGQWVQANDTTLGADNGIGLALGLALIDDDAPHGPLKFLATVHEEVGLMGALNLGLTETDTSGDRYLINLDTEYKDQLIIACGGSGRTEINLPTESEPIGDKTLLRLSVGKLLGGHSGETIGEGKQNAIKVLAKALSSITGEMSGAARLVSIKGGEAHNSIPKNAEAIVALDPADIETFLDLVAQLETELRESDLLEAEKNVELQVADIEGDAPQSMLTADSTAQTLNLISELPHGVKKMSDKFPGLPETSTNLAVVKTDENGITITTSTRSLINDERDNLRKEIQTTAEASGASVKHHPAYSGWQSLPDSELVQLVAELYKELTGEEMIITATHSGIECGGVLGNDKFAHLETAVSFGPTIEGPHTTEERVDIISVGQKYRLLRNAVARIAA